MGLSGESKLALLGDPLQGTPDYINQLDFQPPVSPEAFAMEPPAVPQNDAELERIETALINILRRNTNEAIGQQFYRKRRWLMYMMMEAAKPPLDDPNDPLVQLGYFIPILAKFSDMMGALIMQILFPDPSAQDWFELDAKPLWPGIEMLAEAITNLERDKFRQSCPSQPGGFLGVVSNMLRDLRTFGNFVGLVTHDIISDPLDPTSEDGLIEGPQLRRVPPQNAFPWRDDVGSFAETFTAIYDPMTVDQAHQMDFVNTDKLFKDESPKRMRNLYMTQMLDSFQGNSILDEWRSPGPEQYERWVGIGRFPFYQLRQELGTQEDKVVFEPDFDALMQTLSVKFQFNPLEVKPETWFDIEWVGDTVVKCKPYELALPKGMGPIWHYGLYPRADYLWADGIYDRCQWDARFFNSLQRAVLTIVSFSAKGVFTANKDMLDQTWYQMHGSQLKFSPGDIVELDTRPGDNRKFFEKAETNEKAIPLIREQMGQQLAGIRMITGIYEDLEGNSDAGTATQSANNLQQGMAIIESICKVLEDGPLKELVARYFVVMQQAAQTIGHSQDVVMSSEQNVLSQITLTPEDIINLNCFYIRMTGRNSPANKMNLLDKLIAISQMCAQWGTMDLNEAQRLMLTMAGVPGWANRLAFQPDPGMMMAMMQNLQQTAGAGWAHYVPPGLQQQMGMMMIGGPEMAGQGPPGSQNGNGQYSSNGKSSSSNTSGNGRGYNTEPGQAPQMAQAGSMNGGPPMMAGRNF